MEEKEELVEYARHESEEFRRLEKEHRDFGRELDSKFGGKKYLTAEEEIEKRTLQKQKLSKKDRMQAILTGFKAGVGR